MLADFYIPRLWNDMKIAVQKNKLEGQILYRSLDPSKKTASVTLFTKNAAFPTTFCTFVQLLPKIRTHFLSIFIFYYNMFFVLGKFCRDKNSQTIL